MNIKIVQINEKIVQNNFKKGRGAYPPSPNQTVKKLIYVIIVFDFTVSVTNKR